MTLAGHLKSYALCRWPLLAPRSCHWGGLVPPSWHPGSTFTHHGSSRMVPSWSNAGFSLILGWFWDPILRVCLAPRLEISICFGTVSRSLFIQIYESKFRRLGHREPGFRMAGTIFQNHFSAKFCFYWSMDRFFVFFTSWNPFPWFCCPVNTVEHLWILRKGIGSE